jgi:DNA-binding LacI/PurR family transcriptional regulator
MRPRSVTQKDVAERVGASTATVSRALNDQPGVSPDVRARIVKAAGEMGYSRSANAHGLVTSVRHTVAFVVHAAHAVAEDPFYPIIMTGAEAYLSQHNYHVLLSILDGHVTTRPQEFSVVSQGLVDGLIIAGPDIPAAFIIGMLAAGVPLVLVDNCLSQTATNCVLNDDRGGAYAATRHLIEHGHVRIVFLSGPPEWASSQERARGYRNAMEEGRLEPLVLEGPQATIATGAELVRQALERWPDVTAVCAVNDAVAIGAMRAAADLGRPAPDDLAVIGFDDVGWASINEPSLSTVHVFKRRIGELAAQRVLDCIQNPDAAPVKILVSTELVVRESCGHRH